MPDRTDIPAAARGQLLEQTLSFLRDLRQGAAGPDLLLRLAESVRGILGYRRVLICAVTDAGDMVPTVDLDRTGAAGAPATRIPAALLSEQHRLGASYFIRFDDPAWPPQLRLRRPDDPAPADHGRWQAGDALLTPVTAPSGALLGAIAVDEPADGDLPGAETLQHLELAALEAAQVMDPQGPAAQAAGARQVSLMARLLSQVTVGKTAAHGGDGIILLDPSRSVVFCNRQAEPFLARGEAPGPLRLADHDQEWLQQALGKLAKGAGPGLRRVICRDGALTELWLRRVADGEETAGYLVVLADAAAEALARFRGIREDVNAAVDGETIGDYLLAALKRSIDYDSAALFSREKGGQLKLTANAGLLRKDDRTDERALRPGLAATVLAEGRPMTLTGAAGQTAEGLGLDGIDGAQVASVLAAPLADHLPPTGLLVLARHQGPPFDQAHTALLAELSPVLAGVLGHARVAEKARAESLLRNKLYEIGFSAGSVLQIGSVLSLMIRTIARQLRVEEIGIYFYDDVLAEWNGKSILSQTISPGFLQLVREAGAKLDYEKLSEIRDITAEVIGRGSPEIIPDLAADRRFTQPFPNAGLHSGMWLPLKVKDKTIGALTALSRQPAYFGKDDLALLEEVAPLVTFALRSAMFYEEIRREGGRLAAIINSMPEGLLMIDARYRVIIGNEAFEKLWGLKRPVRADADLKEEILPQLLERLIDNAPLLEFFRRTAAAPGGVAVPVEVELVDHRFLRIGSFPVEDAERPAAGSVLLCQDITIEQQAAKLREEFVGMLSHDLRNPLAAIIATLELALDGSLGDLNENQQQFLTNAMNDSRRMLGMLNDLLDGYKYEAVQLKLEKAPFDITQVIATLVAEFSSLARERDIELLQDTPIGLTVTADEGKINRVVSNLLSNALKFTPKRGRIVVTAAEKPEQIEVSVADNGEGIPPEDQEKVFEKFYQVKKRKLGRKTGTGLGLPLCRQLVEAHGGKIWAESQYGKGSTFIFTLPK
ncbi:MAG: ATP-binding protein [Candidatus Edwardsbacteria bacterium]|nr:ATP-binding protein [Candidatus Edwardsbacteria bacterium]